MPGPDAARRRALLDVARARSVDDVLTALARGAAAGLEGATVVASQATYSGIGATVRSHADAAPERLAQPTPLAFALRPILASLPQGMLLDSAESAPHPAIIGSARREWGGAAHALLAAPLRSAGGRLEGILHAKGRGEKAFSPADLEFLIELASHGAVALGHSRRDALARAAQDRLATFSTFSSDVLWDWDVRSGRIWWSENCGRELMDPPGDLLCPPPERGGLVHPDDWPAYEASYRRALESGASGWTVEYRLRTRTGADLPMIERGWIMRDARGQATRVFGAIANATQRREAEELRAQRDAAVQMERLKGEFLANMSHEIRTPLGAVIGMASLLTDTQLGEEQSEYVRTIHASGEHLLSVINDILDLSKLDAGHAEVASEPFHVRDAIDASLDILAPRAAEKRLALEQSVADDVPAWVLGDASRLRQVLVNLVGNAVKFTDRGSVKLRVAADPEGTLRFEVEDTGIGMRPAEMDRLFQPFTQVHSEANRAYGGTGLGLTISKRFVGLMGGDIAVRSEPGTGSTFTFTIRAPPAAAPARALRREPPLPPRLRILIAEDWSPNQTVALRLLAKLGYEADVAGNGREAVEAVKRRDYDVVFMDVQMPEVDGLQATALIRALPLRQPRIVAMTANALRGDRERCLQAGMDDYVAKPIILSDLRAALARVTGTATEAPPQEALIEATDRDYLAQFDPAERGEVLAVLQREIPPRIEAMGAALVSRNLAQLAAEAHRLRGAARLLGLRDASLLCIQIEQLERDRATAADAEPLVERLLASLPSDVARLHAAPPRGRATTSR